MAISSGGITEEWGEPRHVLTRLMDTVAGFAPVEDGDYFVDIAFRSWHNFREPEFHGVQPDVVGRKQRRFVVWHSVPQGLATDAQAQRWLAPVLPETADLCRTHLPTKSRAYPAEDLAHEVEALAAHLTAIVQDQDQAPPAVPRHRAVGAASSAAPGDGGFRQLSRREGERQVPRALIRGTGTRQEPPSLPHRALGRLVPLEP